VTAGERLVVGQVRGFHGLRGTLRVETLSDRAEERFAVGKVLFVEGRKEMLTIAESAPDNLGWRLRFVEVPDRNAAESLRDVYLEAVVSPGEELPKDEFYWHEIIGVPVKDVDGSELGKVVDLYRAGGADVVVVRGPAGETDIALVKALVKVFDPAKGEIVVDGDALGLRGDEEDAAADEDVARVEVETLVEGSAGADGPAEADA
jgi:16S rRNA processing protein RimM